MKDTAPRQDDIRSSRTAFLWVGLIVPLLIIALATAVIAAWLPELPDPVATHWGTDGVNGYGPPWTYLAITVGVGGGLVLFIGLIALFAQRQPQASGKPTVGRWSPATRFLGGMNLGLAAMLSFVSLMSVAIQRGLADAAYAPDIGSGVLIGIALLVVGAVLGWFLQPKSPTYDIEPAEAADSIPLAATERAAWFGTAMMARSGVIVLAIGVAVLAAMTVFVAAGGDDAWWILALVTLVLALAIGTMAVFRVRVNAQGLRARSLLGWPNNRIPIDRIAKVETVQINPMAEFGGWGWRIGVDGRRGIVLRTGEALQITQTNGRVFVVTVDRASDAAAVLETLRAHNADDRRRP